MGDTDNDLTLKSIHEFQKEDYSDVKIVKVRYSHHVFQLKNRLNEIIEERLKIIEDIKQEEEVKAKPFINLNNLSIASSEYESNFKSRPKQISHSIPVLKFGLNEQKRSEFDSAKKRQATEEDASSLQSKQLSKGVRSELKRGAISVSRATERLPYTSRTPQSKLETIVDRQNKYLNKLNLETSRVLTNRNLLKKIEETSKRQFQTLLEQKLEMESISKHRETKRKEKMDKYNKQQEKEEGKREVYYQNL